MFSAKKETFLFLKRWCHNPLRLGALFPSSKFLSEVMAREAIRQISKDEYVLELGPGTGSFTQSLIEKGVSQDRIVCVELDRDLAQYLRKKFPGILVLEGNAAGLKDLLHSKYHQKIGVVVSGLPMVGISSVTQQMILDSCFDVLKPQGCFLQFTYSPKSSIPSERFGLEKKRLSWVFRNLPPATVWSYKRIGL